MKAEKEQIRKKLEIMREENEREISKLNDRVSLLEYESLVREAKCGKVWTDALNRALSEHQIVEIPDMGEPYYVDAPIIMHSNNRIEAAQNALIKKTEGMRVLLIRNENVVDESHYPCPKEKEKDFNISIEGGIWVDYTTKRGVYGTDSVYDEADSFNGVYTCMLFSNVKNLSLKNLKLVRSAGFAVQVGNGENFCFENIEFINCFADGIHINGNTKNVLVQHIHGQVGDDIVALNMYDWDNSSINFGPLENVWCEDVELSGDSPYKAIRIQPGIYDFDDGSSVDCRAENLVLKNIRGINNFKLYLQTARYKVADPKPGKVGNGDNLYFEDISIELDKPIDEFEPYLKSDPVNGAIAGFEFGANIKNISFENIRVNMYRDKFPESYLAVFGPKSYVNEANEEVFDPYVKCSVENLYLKDIFVNGKLTTEPEEYVKEIVFDRIYDSDFATGWGKIKNIIKE